MKRAGRILWPSCLAALSGEAVFFAIFDPVDLSLLWDPLGPSRLVAYSAGFFLFWAFTAASSALTLFLQRTSDDMNYVVPPKRAERPQDSPGNVETYDLSG